MALIKKRQEVKKEKIKIEISEETYLMIRKYCEWAGIEDLGYFIEEAAHFVFRKDKEWKNYQENQDSVSKAGS